MRLLCIDFKILAKVTANRVKPIFSEFIGEHQTGFLPGRNIQHNIRKTTDIITHVYQSGKRAVIVSIDFLKCFECLEHESIFKTLEFFGFGKKFIALTKIFFNDLVVHTQNAGMLSQPFSKTRGCNQGCNYSPFCYLICGELMAHLIQTNKFIKGIKIGRNETENVISQFADDTCLFLVYEE